MSLRPTVLGDRHFFNGTGVMILILDFQARKKLNLTGVLVQPKTPKP